MAETEEAPTEEAPTEITCSGGIVLPPLFALLSKEDEEDNGISP